MKQIAGPNPQSLIQLDWDWAPECAFLIHSQVRLMRRVWSSQLENHGTRALKATPRGRRALRFHLGPDHIGPWKPHGMGTHERF